MLPNERQFLLFEYYLTLLNEKKEITKAKRNFLGNTLEGFDPRFGHLPCDEGCISIYRGSGWT